jgi:hypothetical protein
MVIEDKQVMSLAEVNEQLLRENAQLRLENERLLAKLKENESEIQPLKHKLQVAEQALLFNADLMSRYREDTFSHNDSTSADLQLARSASEAKLLNQKLKVTEQALLYNSDRYFQILESSAIEKEKELSLLRQTLQEKEEQLRKIADAELHPLKQKLRITEQALLYNSDRYFELLESHVSASEAKLLNQKLKVTEQALLYNSDRYCQILESSAIENEKELSLLRKTLQEKEEQLRKIADAELQPLKQKLRVTEQALLYNSDRYFELLESHVSASEAKLLNHKLKVTEQALLYNSDRHCQLLETSAIEKEKELSLLRQTLQEKEEQLRKMADAELQPLKQKLRITEQALLYNSDRFFDLLESHATPSHSQSTPAIANN